MRLRCLNTGHTPQKGCGTFKQGLKNFHHHQGDVILPGGITLKDGHGVHDRLADTVGA